MNAPIIRFDGWTLNPQSGELERGSSRLRLQEHSLQVLQALIERPGEVVPREQLIARLWPSGVVDFEMGLNTAVRRLRTALGDTADTPRYIETLPRRGYRFIGSLERSDSAPATASLPGKLVSPSLGPVATLQTNGGSVEGAPNRSTAPPRVATLITVAVLAAVVLFVVALWFIGGAALRRSATVVDATPVARAASAHATLPPRHSLAVLPFANLSGDSNQDYFSDGLSEELLEALSRVDQLQVAGRTSSFQFRGSGMDLRVIGAKLNVASILEGSVRRSGQTARIHAQLVDANTGFRLWSQTYDRNLGDVLDVQTEIANAVVGALKITLSDAASKIDLGGTRNAGALNAYLRGLSLADRTVSTAAEARTLIGSYDEAVRFDPEFALAYAARARALADYAGHFTVDATREAFSKARRDAERAIALAPTLGDGHAALGEVLEYGFLDFGAAAAAYARALALAPGNARVLRAYSRFAGYMGQSDKAIAAARRNVALDPFNVLAHFTLGEVLRTARKYMEAVAEFDEAIKLNPRHASEIYQRRGRTLYLLGQYESAAAACEQEPDRYEAQLCLPLAYEKLGRRAEAQSVLTTAEAEQGDYAAYQFAQIYAQWGSIPKALDWLETAVRLQDPGLEYLKTDPFLDPLRGQPRFQAIENALRFPR